MFRLWVKQWKENHLLKDTVICDDSDRRRTQKVFGALESACRQFDLAKPIWLDKTIKEFQLHSKTRFYQDNFIEEVPFDYLEIEVIEDD
ncbi:MAG: hypothetical protein K5739_09330 [Lachnospiraceae bacterium]|nr:hypothetical protein [Lachnospiraceae bacterium]